MTIGTRIMLEDRVPLNELLPLEAPLVLFVDPSDACTLECNFCPTRDRDLMKEVGRPLKIMDFELYKKLVDSFVDFKTNIKVLRLYSHGEPLMNKNFCDMVKYAKDSGKVDFVDTTTNATLLNPSLNLKLIESGIDRINISINGVNKEQYFSFTNRSINFDNLVGNIRHLYENRKDCYLFIKINGDTISEEDEKTFLRIFEPIADSVAIERAFNCWNEFEASGFNDEIDTTVGVYGQSVEKEVLICPYIFYSLAVQSDGCVSLCFLDWNRKLILGDIKSNSIKDIWNGNALKNIRQMMLEGKRKEHMYCCDCNQMIGGMPEDLDKYKEGLLEIYK